MLEYVYQLKLPPLDKMLIEGIAEKMLAPSTKFKYLTATPESIIKPEYLTLNNFRFNHAILFHKSGGELGRIHRDTVNLNKTIWGINWIYSGEGILEYWEDEELENEKVVEKKDEQGFMIKHYISSIPSKKIYKMIAPNAYLVNATKIHRPVGWGSRWAVSLRAGTGDISWESVVEIFKDYIV